MFLEEDGVEKPAWSPGLDWKQTWASFFHPPEFICVALSYNMEPFNSCSRTATAATYFQFPGFASVLNKHCYKQFYKPSPRVHVRVKLEKSSDRSTHLMLFILASQIRVWEAFSPILLSTWENPNCGYLWSVYFIDSAYEESIASLSTQRWDYMWWKMSKLWF